MQLCASDFVVLTSWQSWPFGAQHTKKARALEDLRRLHSFVGCLSLLCLLFYMCLHTWTSNPARLQLLHHHVYQQALKQFFCVDICPSMLCPTTWRHRGCMCKFWLQTFPPKCLFLFIKKNVACIPACTCLCVLKRMQLDAGPWMPNLNKYEDHLVKYGICYLQQSSAKDCQKASYQLLCWLRLAACLTGMCRKFLVTFCACCV